MRNYPALTVQWISGGDDERADRLLATLDDCRVTAVEDAPNGLRLFFHAAADRDRARGLLTRETGLEVESSDVSDEDWAARSQASIGAVRVGDITVAPPWAAESCSSKHLIVIQPSTGFGTGHHASTRLCLHWLQTFDGHAGPFNRTVVDVGTGSGVLALAAAVLMANQPVVAFDPDPDAIANARENSRLNPGLHGKVEFLEMDLATMAGTGRGFDLVLANLTGGMLIRDAELLTRLAGSSQTSLIASGFQTDEAPAVIAALAGAGWVLEDQAVEEGWVGALFTSNRRTPLDTAPGA